MMGSRPRNGRGYLGAVLAGAFLVPVAGGIIVAQGGDQFLDGTLKQGGRYSGNRHERRHAARST